MNAGWKDRLRPAWANGNEDDRYFALHFVLEQVKRAGIDLVVDGIDDPNPAIAEQSALIVAVVLDKLAPAAPALRRFNDRFPRSKIEFDRENHQQQLQKRRKRTAATAKRPPL